MRYLMLPLLLFAISAQSQLPYDLIVLDQPYEALTEATALDSNQFDLGIGWDDPEFSVPLGFDFDFSGQSISSWDQLGLGTLMMGTSIDDKSGLPLLHGVIPTGFDVIDRGLVGLDPSIIRWQTSGAPGEQVFTIEWANAGFYEELEDSTSISFLNLQVRLFEADGALEFHYGPSVIEDPTLFEPAICGLLLNLDPFSYSADVYALDGASSDPNIVSYTAIEEWYYGAYLLSHPADGTVYRWAPAETTLVMEQRGTQFTAWPNPTAGEVNLAFDGAHMWTVLDATGRVVMSGEGQDGQRLDLSGLDAGAYTVRLDNGAAQRLVKH